MGYVAIRGGEKAIRQAAAALEFLRTRAGGDPISLGQIEHQLWALHSRVLSEGALYDTDLASLAIKQTAGDPLEAAYLVRAWRCTRPRVRIPVRAATSSMRILRRISAAFKDIPGGQILGPTRDYAVRLFRFDLMNEDEQGFRDSIATSFAEGAPQTETTPEDFPKVIDSLRRRGMLPLHTAARTEPAVDITREPLQFPVSRSAALAALARGETGSLLALAYSNMRGYGDIHPTVAELRVGYLPVHLAHPVTGEFIEAGEVLMTECEVVAMYEPAGDGTVPQFTLGYGACYGQNEVKAISMAILDRALQRGALSQPANPSEDPEFVLLHIDGIESMGFCTHYKMPHYVTFTADIDRLVATQERKELAHVRF